MSRKLVYRRQLKQRSFQSEGFKLGPYGTITILSALIAAAIHLFGA